MISIYQFPSHAQVTPSNLVQAGLRIRFIFYGGNDADYDDKDIPSKEIDDDHVSKEKSEDISDGDEGEAILKSLLQRAESGERPMLYI